MAPEAVSCPHRAPGGEDGQGPGLVPRELDLLNSDTRAALPPLSETILN